jgi:hypothetical protein
MQSPLRICIHRIGFLLWALLLAGCNLPGSLGGPGPRVWIDYPADGMSFSLGTIDVQSLNRANEHHSCRPLCGWGAEPQRHQHRSLRRAGTDVSALGGGCAGRIYTSSQGDGLLRQRK